MFCNSSALNVSIADPQSSESKLPDALAVTHTEILLSSTNHRSPTEYGGVGSVINILFPLLPLEEGTAH